jgi:hypothetical protein
MNELGNKYAAAALRERRAEIAGEITALDKRLAHLRDMLVHIDATLRLFDPDADPSRIAPKRPYRRVKLFGSGKLNRLVLSALRDGARPMTTGEVIAAIVAELGYGPDAAKAMSHRVRANLLYLSKGRGLVVKEGERQSARWKLAG